MNKLPSVESETVEFKERWTKEALKDVAGFANHYGGKIFLGVRDNGTVAGFGGGDDDQQRIANQISDELHVTPKLDLQMFRNKPVLVMEVSPAERLVVHRGRYLTRVGTTNRDMTPEELGRRMLEVTGRKWDTLPSTLGIDAVDNEPVTRFVELARAWLPKVKPGDPPQRILHNLQLFHEGKLTNAGALLFAAAPQAIYPQARVRIGRFKNSEILDSHEFEGSLWDTLDKAMNKLRDILAVRFDVTVKDPSLKGLQRQDVWEYPLDALREALINALIHRDYAAHGDIQIRVYDDRLTIWNPGGLPEGIRLEQLYEPEHHSVLRNPLIAQVFHYAGFIEKWGTGTTRIIRLCEAQGLSQPIFEEPEGAGFRVIFAKDPYSTERLESLSLSDRQVRAVLYAKEKGSIRNKEYQELNEVSKPTATRDLDDLVDQGVLVKKGTTGRGVRYELKGSKRAQTAQKRLRKGSKDSGTTSQRGQNGVK